jgi:membrane protein YqaA with SNARE-associated domain
VKLFFATFFYAFVGGVFPLFNVEAYLITASALSSWSSLVPLVVAAATGQMAGKCVMYLTGIGLLRQPIRAAREKIERIAERLRTHRRGTWTLLAISAFVGLPPFYFVSIAAGTLRLNFWLFLIIGLAGRLLRFAAIFVVPQLVQWGW